MLETKFEELLDSLIVQKKRHKKSMDEIAVNSQVSRPTVSRLLSIDSRNRVNVDSLLKVARYFDNLNKEVK